MSLELQKDSIDLGIVVKDPAACVAFYRDVLGLTDLGESPMPGGSMHRLGCGTSVIKLVSPQRPPAAEAHPGGLRGATGYRYWTVSVVDLDGVVAACESAGRPVVIPPTELRPGVRIAMVEDPDGNWVELLSNG
jgi:glyoxylase I family protein